MTFRAIQLNGVGQEEFLFRCILPVAMPCTLGAGKLDFSKNGRIELVMHSDHQKGELAFKFHLLFLTSQYPVTGIFSINKRYCFMLIKISIGIFTRLSSLLLQHYYFFYLYLIQLFILEMQGQ